MPKHSNAYIYQERKKRKLKERNWCFVIMSTWKCFLKVLEDPLLLWAVWLRVSYSTSLNLNFLIWGGKKRIKQNTHLDMALQVAFLLPFSEVLLLNLILHNSSFSEVLFFPVWLIQLGKIQTVKSLWEWRNPPNLLYDRLIIVCLMNSTSLAIY